MMIEIPLLDPRFVSEKAGFEYKVFINTNEVKSLESGLRRSTSDGDTPYTRVYMDMPTASSWYTTIPIDEMVKLINDPTGEWIKQVSGVLNESIEILLSTIFPQRVIQGEQPAEESASPHDRIFSTPEDVPNGIHHVVDKDGDFWGRKLGGSISNWYPAGSDGTISTVSPQTENMRLYGPFRKV
ncbi:hypothetical protein SEA_CHEWYVIII_10 [Rhodococcus phage ChewyVIII]|uniref:Uncharacterized protein n=1 Tax=Rhodococcus phage ChewyVIII TaxID=1887657 RepID=A0A1C9EI01_9CAUD|nr:hypothetical protein QEH30_gp10 [Rhodococcus phage ChewyVIII]AON97433.1 hypothetical protein SEA_CHEWYVIII_10 [Rhodococcus phage ChewyVIII]